MEIKLEQLLKCLDIADCVIVDCVIDPEVICDLEVMSLTFTNYHGDVIVINNDNLDSIEQLDKYNIEVNFNETENITLNVLETVPFYFG